MANRLSHSSINKFLQCGEAWRLHYRERIRPTEIGSALIFGSAIGKAFEAALDPTKNAVENAATPKEIFDYHFTYADVNGVLTNLKESDDVAYSKYDLDPELGDTPWDSLRAKGHLILDAFESKFLPLVEKIWSTEEKIELANEEGDSSIGFADAVLSIRGYDRPIIMDFKTAARRYEPDAVLTSVQLSQYLHILGPKYDTRTAGYAVFLKNIIKNRVKTCTLCGFDGSGSRHQKCPNMTLHLVDEVEKRCNGEWAEKIKPEAEMQIIIDEIPENFENFVIDNIATVNDAIKANIFVKNVNSCKDNGWGRPCEFYNRCHKGTMEGLVKLEEKKEE
jgi:hypothetical protein